VLAELGRRNGAESDRHLGVPGDDGSDVSDDARCRGQHGEPVHAADGRRVGPAAGSNDDTRTLLGRQSVSPNIL